MRCHITCTASLPRALARSGGTELSFAVTANMGGKIAQLGARLMTSTAKKYADRFFDAFAEQVGGKLEDEVADDGGATA